LDQYICFWSLENIFGTVQRKPTITLSREASKQAHVTGSHYSVARKLTLCFKIILK
jgi:hypothetical protein